MASPELPFGFPTPPFRRSAAERRRWEAKHWTWGGSCYLVKLVHPLRKAAGGGRPSHLLGHAQLTQLCGVTEAQEADGSQPATHTLLSVEDRRSYAENRKTPLDLANAR